MNNNKKRKIEPPWKSHTIARTGNDKLFKKKPMC